MDSIIDQIQPIFKVFTPLLLRNLIIFSKNNGGSIFASIGALKRTVEGGGRA